MDPDDPTAGLDVAVALARLEAKLDVALAQHGAQLGHLEAARNDHESRLRRIEERPAVDATDVLDHESRLRELERTPTVSPRTLWTVCLGALGAVVSLIPLIDRLYN